jgi:uncharacterized integral membrane protein
LKYLKAAILSSLAIAGVLFGVSNQQNASVHFFWYFSKSYPLYLVLFASFLAGTLVSLIYGILSSGDMKDEERRLNRLVNELKERLRLTDSARGQTPGRTDGSAGFF